LARIAEADAGVVGVYFYDFNGRDSVVIGTGVALHTASMMKVPVMIQVFRDVDSGTLTRINHDGGIVYAIVIVRTY
jgi:beta-lactamase class A